MKTYTSFLGNLRRLLDCYSSGDILLITVSFIAVILLSFLFVKKPEAAQFVAYLVGGAIIIFLANRRAKAMETNVRLSEKGLSLERFKFALELLSKGNAATRVGAVYALHRMAQDEQKACESAFDVLCEYIRHAKPSDMAAQIALKLIFSVDGASHYDVADRKAHLSGANLANQVLSNLTLISADLSNADLSGTDIRGTDLTNANLTEANIQNVKTDSSTVMREAILNGITISSTSLPCVDFSGADFRPSTKVTSFTHVNFSDCNFNNAHMDDASFDSSNFEGAKNLTKEQLLSARSLYEVRGLPDTLRETLYSRKPSLFKQSQR